MPRLNYFGLCILIICISFFPDTKALTDTVLEKDIEKPLILTPMINSEKVEEARKMSKVVYPDMYNVSSYAGYLTVNEEYDSNMYFMFFEAQNEPKKAPVILYLAGGLGEASTSHVFIENGPFTIDKNMSVKLREYSWHKIANMLYIDNPVGAGFSFTNDSRGYAKNEIDVGVNLLAALNQFFRLFRDLRENPFYVAGVSYAGKYVPAIAKAIKDYNNLHTGPKINLQGMSIANGLTDPLNQFIFGDYLYQIGLIDVHGLKEFKEYEALIRKLINDKKYLNASVMMSRLLTSHVNTGPSLFYNLTGLVDYSNYLQPNMTTIIDSIKGLFKWSQRPDVGQAFHVGIHTSQRESVREHLMSEFMESQADVMAEVLDHYRALIFMGQLDIIVPYPSVVNYLQNLKWTGAETYKTAERKIWKVDNEVAGYTKTAGKLTEVLVRNAGHVVCMDQPKYAFDLIKRFLNSEEF